MPKLAHSLNKSVIVSIPAFFGDDAPRQCILVDIEPFSGVWLKGDALNEQLGEHKAAAPPDNTLASVFFPFNQVVYVFDPTQFAHLARSLGARTKPTKAAEPPSQAVDVHRTGRRRERPANQHDRPSKKGSKRRR
jgi:hypothetical protein